MSDSPRDTVSFSLTVKDGNAALDFYAKAFDAKELYRMPTPDGGVGHAEMMIGNTRIFLSEEFPDWKAFAMPKGHLTPCLLCIEVEDCDASYAKALAAGAESISEPKDEFWGMRSSVVSDPFGFRWSFGQIIEELTPEEVSKRAADIYGG